MSASFWATFDALVASCPLVIDRPQGSAHPQDTTVLYPYDYGYLATTRSGDGSGIDVWVGSLPVPTLTAIVCTIDPRPHKRDAEIKLLLGCTLEDAQTIVAFHSSDACAALLIPRPAVAS